MNLGSVSLVAEWQWQTDQTQWKSGMWPRSLQRDELRIGVLGEKEGGRKDQLPCELNSGLVA